MKRKLSIVLGTALVVQALFIGSASAQHVSKWDKKLNVNTGTNLFSDCKLGQTTYNLQESAHNLLTGITGAEVDHSYIWVGVDGNYILAIDPPQAMYN